MSFQEIYDRQLVFENLIISRSNELPNKLLQEFNDKEKTEFCKDLSLMLHQEISEFMNAVGNYKKHKKTKDVTNVKDVKEEIADELIFVLNKALVFKMTADELLEQVSKKQDKNFKRQEEGY